MQESLIEIINPTATRECKKLGLAVRKSSQLHRQRIGLLDNSKPNADQFLGFVGALLKKRCEGAEIVFKRKMSRTEADCIQELIKDCDVVINAFAD